MATRQIDIDAFHLTGYNFVTEQQELLTLQLFELFDRLKTRMLDLYEKTLSNYYDRNAASSKSLRRVFPSAIKAVEYGHSEFIYPTYKAGDIEGAFDAIAVVSVASLLDVPYELFDEVIFSNGLEAYAQGGRDTFQLMGMSIDFQIDNIDAVRQLKSYTLNLSNQVSEALQGQIKNVLLEGLADGKNGRQVKKAILEVWNKPITINVKPKYDSKGKIVRRGYTRQMSASQWAETVGRTEINRAYNWGRTRAYRQSGVVEKVRFAVSPDERLCPVCAQREGDEVSLNDADGIIPLHANCRCTWIPILKEYDKLFKSVDIDTRLIEYATSLIEEQYNVEKKFNDIGIENVDFGNVDAIGRLSLYDAVVELNKIYGEKLFIKGIQAVDGAGRANVYCYYDVITQNIFVNEKMFENSAVAYSKLSLSTMTNYILRGIVFDLKDIFFSTFARVYINKIDNEVRTKLRSRFSEHDKQIVSDVLGSNAAMNFYNYVSSLFAAHSLHSEQIKKTFAYDYKLFSNAIKELQ